MSHEGEIRTPERVTENESFSVYDVCEQVSVGEVAWRVCVSGQR